MAIRQFNVTDLDFDDIKNSIKDYYKREASPFKDFDFEGSGLNLILDVLAHNTHYNAVLAHLAANETFISSAQLRKNVVARAKSLGYTPESMSAARSTITLTDLDTSITTIPKGTVFSAADTVRNKTYNFITIEEIGTPTSPFEVYQGSLKNIDFLFNSNDDKQSFTIPDKNVDITKISVKVRESSTSSKREVYTPFTELPGIDGDSNIYFINENPSGLYEIRFGDGVLGKLPATASVIEIEYFVTDGPDGNGMTEFTTAASVFNGTVIPTISATRSSAGKNREAIESIREQAPLSFLAQNRAVTVDDYKTQVLSNLTSVSAVSVWGGEDNDPPEYGRVFVAAKPSSGLVLTSAEKNKLTDILNQKGVMTVRPKVVDPEYVYLYFDIFAKYNRALTTLSAGSMSSTIRSALSTFNSSYLSDFGGVFRYSQFLEYITDVSSAITSAFARVYIYKILSAYSNNTSAYTLKFRMELDNPTDPTESVITSSGYVNNGVTYYFKDEPSVKTNIRNIYRYYINANNIEIIDERNVGTVNTTTGVVVFNDFDIASNTDIAIYTRSKANDIAAQQNQILQIASGSATNITSEIDTVALRGSAGTAQYNPTSREK